MSDLRPSRAKLLFVLSNDYGELSNALYLVRGYGFRTVLLMPERLFRANQEGLPVRANRYRTPADVLDAVDREKPDVVLLFSGYLYAINQIFDLDAVAGLVHGLRSRDCRVVTSDPFLGILSRPDGTVFNDRHPLKSMLTEHFARLSAAFAGITHLYPILPGDWAPLQSVSFFNPNVILPHSAIEEGKRTLAGRIGLDLTRNQWLFILSQEDYEAQARFRGRDRFDVLLIEMLRQAGREGRQPVVVGPQSCLASLKGRGLRPEESLLLAYCGQDLFLPLLLGAEYAFFWNIFSNSIMARAANNLPVFFFDRGHMAHAIPPLFEAGMRYYYLDSELPYVNAEERLASRQLDQLATRQAQSLEGARAQFRRSPSPENMLKALLQGVEAHRDDAHEGTPPRAGGAQDP